MRRSARAATGALVLVIPACSRATRAAGPDVAPAPVFATAAPRSGLEVVGRMRRAHPSRELKSLRFTVTTEFRDQPPRASQSLAYALLPGRLRVEALPSTTRSGSVRDRQRMTVFRAGRRVATARRVDLVSLLTFDVFAQNVDTTIMWLDSARVRFGYTRRSAFNDREVWVVGAVDGDSTSAQFWVDADEWRVVRVIQRDPRQADRIVDVRYTDFTELLDVPVPTRVEVWRDGQLAEVQTMSDFTVNLALPRNAFDLRRWTSVNAGN
ncbi:MAG TPA: hypothetical protein VJ867_00595 [Gemmatimonadaceae bacterium]|nr:hypothetical protein [Gemmatimonadaceae bacterium]